MLWLKKNPMKEPTITFGLSIVSNNFTSCSLFSTFGYFTRFLFSLIFHNPLMAALASSINWKPKLTSLTLFLLNDILKACFWLFNYPEPAELADYFFCLFQIQFNLLAAMHAFVNHITLYPKSLTKTEA